MFDVEFFLCLSVCMKSLDEYVFTMMRLFFLYIHVFCKCIQY